MGGSGHPGGLEIERRDVDTITAAPCGSRISDQIRTNHRPVGRLAGGVDAGARMTDKEVIAAIQKNHLKANIDQFEREPDVWGRPDWSKAWLDPGGTIFGPGP